MLKLSDELDAAKAAAVQAGKTGEFVCAGEDLKDMLALLSRQFAEADQRNCAALDDMRGRLETLGRTADDVREHVPPQYSSAFARIEDGVQHLADRIAAVGREREAAKAAAALGPMPAAVVSEQVATPAPAIAGAPPTVAVPVTPQVVAAPEPVPQSLPGNAADPWDRDAADALARLYDSGEARMSAQPVEPLPTPSHNAFVPSAPPTVAPQVAAVDGADRAWLEQRFADIASRVEQSLADMRPDNALLAFDGRLEQFEHRFSSALGDVATRADVEGLRIIEAHINELSAQFERTHAQLDRLDQIEQHLGDLMHQVSDERFADLFQHFAPAAHQGPTDDDIEAVAMAVADRVASRLPQVEAPVSAIEQGSISDLKRLVEGFVAGQRESEEHTSTMLDTMQQAMIRMLDRMDALEHAAPSYPAPQASFAAPMPQPVPAPLAHHPRVEPVAPQPAAPVEEPVEPARVAAARPAPQSKEDFRAAAVADARRAARKVANQAVEAGAVASGVVADEAPRVRRGAPAVEISPPAPEPEEKPRSRTPLMVAGIALVAAIGLLAASVGLNRAGPGVATERQTAQQQSKQKAPLAVDNGTESAGGDVAQGAPRSDTPTPSISGGNGNARPAPAAAPQRPGASLVEPQGALRNRTDMVVEGEEGTGEAAAAQHEASYRAPSTDIATGALGVVATPTNAVPPNSDLARMRQQRNMASLASQLQAIQASAPTVPASMLPEGSIPAADAAASTPVEMPPAQIGPNSLRLAAKNGDPSAEFEVAARFAEGRGVAQDFRQANVWYSRAAQRGFAPAQYRLGTLFERGIGAKADVARAKVWYGRAAEQGHVKAMHNLAVLNAGREQSADYAAAVHWFTQAAERGLADSQFNLGVLYESGLGLQRDLKQAYHWLSLAARTGDKEAARRRDQVRMKLEEADAAAADEAVNAWRARPVDQMVNEARAAGEAWKQRQAAR